MLTGTELLTNVSEPALLPKRTQPSTIKLTSMKLKAKQVDTKLIFPTKLLNGTNKLLTGNQLLKLVLLKRSLVFFQRPTAESLQLKKKLLPSNNHFKPKLKPGSTLKKRNFSLKFQLSKAELLAVSIHGTPMLSPTSLKSKNNSPVGLTTRTPRSLATKLVLKPEELPNVLNFKSD